MGSWAWFVPIADSWSIWNSNVYWWMLPEMTGTSTMWLLVVLTQTLLGQLTLEKFDLMMTLLLTGNWCESCLACFLWFLAITLICHRGSLWLEFECQVCLLLLLLSLCDLCAHSVWINHVLRPLHDLIVFCLEKNDEFTIGQQGQESGLFHRYSVTYPSLGV